MRAAVHRTAAHRRTTTARAPQQRGAALLVILALVLTLGLMGLYMYSSSRTQYQLVGNVQYSEQAFNQVESSMATAEAWTTANPADAAFDSYSATTPHLYPIGGLTASSRDPKTMEWTNSNSAVAGLGRYLIEQLGAGVTLTGGDVGLGGPRNSTCQQVNIYQIHAKSDSVKGTTRMVDVDYATEACKN
jgi:Tfp pilus assembly protein PilX